MFRLQFLGADDLGDPVLLSDDELAIDDVHATVSAVHEATWPPNAVVVRLLDADGAEVFFRLRSDD